MTQIKCNELIHISKLWWGNWGNSDECRIDVYRWYGSKDPPNNISSKSINWSMQKQWICRNRRIFFLFFLDSNWANKMRNSDTQIGAVWFSLFMLQIGHNLQIKWGTVLFHRLVLLSLLLLIYPLFMCVFSIRISLNLLRVWDALHKDLRRNNRAFRPIVPIPKFIGVI